MTDDTNVSHLPDPGVILDLDHAERPDGDVKPPFVVLVGGRKVEFTDPSEIDWQDLAEVQHPADLLRYAMSTEDRQHIQKQSLPTWKFSQLMEAYYNHYDLESKIRNAKRQASLI